MPVCRKRTITRARKKKRGFTLVEMMVALVILAIGLMAITAMQISSIAANTVSQDISHAYAMTGTTLELSRVDSLMWTNSITLSSTRMLKEAPSPAVAGGTSGWKTLPDGLITPVMSGAKVDRNMIKPPDGGWRLASRYCIYYRVTWVYPNETLRVEARVAWLKEAAAATKLDDCLADIGNIDDITSVNSITQSTLLKRNAL